MKKKITLILLLFPLFMMYGQFLNTEKILILHQIPLYEYQDDKNSEDLNLKKVFLGPNESIHKSSKVISEKIVLVTTEDLQGTHSFEYFSRLVRHTDLKSILNNKIDKVVYQ